LRSKFHEKKKLTYTQVAISNGRSDGEQGNQDGSFEDHGWFLDLLVVVVFGLYVQTRVEIVSLDVKAIARPTLIVGRASCLSWLFHALA